MEAESAVVQAVSDWFEQFARPLPWREPGTSPWGVLTSEFMLQQTPAERVAPIWIEWQERWPSPASLAESAQSEAVRAWGRLGYPRRAKWLHQGARLMVAEHGGRVPDTYEALRDLPGVGDYTASAVLAFAFGRRSVVLDTNIRRVLARLEGEANLAPHITAAERERADRLVPLSDAQAALWSASVMELGAVVCTARTAHCGVCPARDFCLSADTAPATAVRRTPQGYAGTDRQVRGLILAALREAEDSVDADHVNSLWSDTTQRERALAGLISDGLVAAVPGSDPVSYRLAD